MKKHGPNSENISQAVLRLGTKQCCFFFDSSPSEDPFFVREILFFVRQSRDSFRPKAPQVQLFPPGGSKSYAESDLVPPEGSTRSCFFRPYEKSVTIQDFFRPEAPEACLRRPVKLALQLEEYCNGSRSVNLNPWVQEWHSRYLGIDVCILMEKECTKDI